MELGKGATLTQIVQVVVVTVGLLFGKDMPIALVGIAVAQREEEPFENVAYIEWNKEHLHLLAKVDSLMVDHILVYPAFVVAPYYAGKAHGPAFGEEWKLYDFHGYRFSRGSIWVAKS